MTHPYKAKPETPGKVVRFNIEKGGSPWQAYRDLVMSAFMLLNTSIAVEELEYETMPSVLILCEEPDSVHIGNWIKSIQNAYLSEKAEQGERSVLVANDFIYGAYSTQDSPKVAAGQQVAKSLIDPSVDLTFSENTFLSSILIDQKTGIHVSHLSKSDSNQAKLRQVQAAQKYFDVVLVPYDSLDTLDNEQSVTVLQYLDSRNDASDLSRFIPIFSYSELVEATNDNKANGEAFSIRYVRDNNDLLMFMVANILVAGLSPDKHTKDVTLLKPTLRERMALRRIKMADSEIGLMLTGIAGTTAAFMGALMGLEFGLFGEELLAAHKIIGIAVGSGAFSLGGYKALSGFSNKDQSIVEQYNKKAVEESEVRQFSYLSKLLPAYENPVFLRLGEDFYDEHAIKQADMQLKPILATAESNDETPVITSRDNDDNSVSSSDTFVLSYHQDIPPASSREAISHVPLSKALLLKRLSKLTSEWMSYELDPMKSLDYPLMLDTTCPQTRRFLQAVSDVRLLEEELDSGEVSLVEFRDALMYAEGAFMEAEGHAKKMRYAHLDTGQKKRIRDARPLVALLDDEDASPHEKVSAYRKAGDFLEGIIALPDRPIMGLLESSQI